MTNNQYLENIIESSAHFQAEKNYWRGKLEGDSVPSVIPADFARFRKTEDRSETLRSLLPEETGRKLLYISYHSEQGAFIILLAGVMRLLTGYANTGDLTVGMPVMKGRSGNKPINDGLLPIRTRMESHLSFKDLILALKQSVSEADQYKNYPFHKLAELLNLESDGSGRFLFNIAVMMTGLHDRNFRAETRTDLIFSFTVNQATVEMSIEYDPGLYRRETIHRLAGHYINLSAQTIENPQIKLADIEILSKEEKAQIIHAFNGARAEYPGSKTIGRLFEEQVERTPGKVAVVFQDQPLTYQELNETSNRLARVLRAKGAGPEQCVGLMTEWSLEMVIGTLGILKAGSAYLPLDPGYPRARIEYMLKDSGAGLLLAESRFMGMQANFSGQEFIDLGDESLYRGDSSNLAELNHPNGLAYVIYTSGSTGNPKGVMIENRSVIRLVKNPNYIRFNPDDRILQTGPVVFDAATFEIWGSLLNGLELYLASKDVILDADGLEAALEKYRITILWLTAPLFNQLSRHKPEMFQTVKHLIVGGDALSPGHINRVRRACPETRVINGYGPTENTTFSTCFTIDRDYEENIPIGAPISNSTAYILGKNGELQPVGVPGELCVGGDGVARGYLNNPELTAGKFVPNPFPSLLEDAPKEGLIHTSNFKLHPSLLYRTGDLARWLPDGKIEFLRRIDSQVKIRGNRIEPGEIEAAVLKYEPVKEAVIMVQEDNDGGKYLCAYLVSSPEITPDALRNYLSGKLPDYMIPSVVINLAQMPLNENGKINRKALPAPSGVAAGPGFVEPRNEIEAKLALAWGEVLGVTGISIHDNFYNLGGDSLKAIRVLAVLRKHGLAFEMRNLFRFPVIADLAGYVKELVPQGKEGGIQGEIGLLQTQRRFFSRNYTEMNYWNGGFVLYRKAGFDETILRKVFDRIVEEHDALRIIFKFEGEKIIQTIRGMEDGLYDFKVLDLCGEANYEVKIREENRKVQASLDLTQGPLMKIVVYKTVEGDHMLLVIHHLVLDGVSIREIIEDFRIGYEQVHRGVELRLQPKTNSLLEWTQKIAEYAASKELFAEIGYWRKLEEMVLPPLPKDTPAASNKIGDGRSITQSLLSLAETERLLQMARRPEGIEIKAALLTAFGLAVRDWTGWDRVMIYLASHGRDNVFEGVDVSRTVGWFSVYYPVLLEFTSPGDSGAQAELTQRMLNNVPNNGIGYEILRYLTLPESRDQAPFKLWPEISFNYSGDFSGEIPGDGPEAPEALFVQSRIFPGLTISPNSERDFTFTVDSGILGGILYLRFHYNRLEYRADTILNLIRKFREHLLQIIEA